MKKQSKRIVTQMKGVLSGKWWDVTKAATKAFPHRKTRLIERTTVITERILKPGKDK